MALGLTTKRRLIDEMRESLTEIPGVRYNFSQPMKDNVEEAVSGRARQGGAENFRS